MLSFATCACLFGENHQLTLHSLRCRAFQACEEASVSIDAVKEAGLWSSEAYKVYLKDKPISMVPSALSLLLG